MVANSVFEELLALQKVRKKQEAEAVVIRFMCGINWGAAMAAMYVKYIYID